MKISGHIDINKPREEVVTYFSNPDYLKEYQDTFIRKELVSGEKGKQGAVSNMYYKQGKGEMELVETITENNLPETFSAFFHHKHMDNTMVCKFESLDENKTRYHYEYEYIRMTFMPKIFSKINPGMFRKPAEKWLNQFKEFVEKQ